MGKGALKCMEIFAVPVEKCACILIVLMRGRSISSYVRKTTNALKL
jgi:hypothetical protein